MSLDLSFGTVEVAEPPLAGYQQIIECLSDADMDAVQRIVQAVWHAPEGALGEQAEGAPAVSEAGQTVLASVAAEARLLLRSSPELGAAFLGACVRRDGEILPTEEALAQATFSDLLAVLEAVIAGGIAGRLKESLGNVLGLIGTAGAATEAQPPDSGGIQSGDSTPTQ